MYNTITDSYVQNRKLKIEKTVLFLLQECFLMSASGSVSGDHEIFILKRCLKENMVSKFENAHCCLLKAKALYQLICVPN